MQYGLLQQVQKRLKTLETSKINNSQYITYKVIKNDNEVVFEAKLPVLFNIKK